MVHGIHSTSNGKTETKVVITQNYKVNGKQLLKLRTSYLIDSIPLMENSQLNKKLMMQLKLHSRKILPNGNLMKMRELKSRSECSGNKSTMPDKITMKGMQMHNGILRNTTSMRDNLQTTQMQIWLMACNLKLISSKQNMPEPMPLQCLLNHYSILSETNTIVISIKEQQKR
jgi:hypothetical protein